MTRSEFVSLAVYLSLKLAQSSSRFGSQPTRSALARSFSSAAILNLPDTLLGNAEQVADLPKAVGAVAGQAEAKIENLAFARPKVFHQERQCLDCARCSAGGCSTVIGHRLGQLEIAVVIEDGIQADGSAGGGLEMRQVFEARARAMSQFLRARQVLAAVGQSFDSLAAASRALASGAGTG